MKDIDKWRGLKALVQDAVEHGTSAIERVHLQTARRTFDVLKLVPPLAEPVNDIHQVYDGVVSGVYASARGVNSLAGKALDVVLDALEAQIEPQAEREAPDASGASES